MQNENSDITQEPIVVYELAERHTRLFAFLLDNFIISLVLIPFMIYNGTFARVMEATEAQEIYQFHPMEMYGYTVLSAMIYILINLNFLQKYGQTIGKRIFRIRMATPLGQVPSLMSLIVRRHLVMIGLKMIPGIGGGIGLADYFMIFYKDRRCLHDMIAGTVVIKA